MTDIILKEELFDSFIKIEEDDSIPKNIRIKLKTISSNLKNKEETTAFRIDKAIQELDEISEGVNVPDYVRTQIWSIVSSLESIE
tara:strand:- start:13 stop:267 length:255 start_codon:yes stop_codon:yes gene_type:complete